jgi:hypothetical protein
MVRRIHGRWDIPAACAVSLFVSFKSALLGSQSRLRPLTDADQTQAQLEAFGETSALKYEALSQSFNKDLSLCEFCAR